jgi:hypothetical protein
MGVEAAVVRADWLVLDSIWVAPLGSKWMSPDIRYLGRDSNRAPYEYESSISLFGLTAETSEAQ